MYKEFISKCKTEPVVMFGAGRRGKFLAEMLFDIGCTVCAFMDNDKCKQGGQLGDIPVISPEQCAKLFDNTWVVLSVQNQEIRTQLLQFGFVGNKIIDLSTFSFGKRPPFYDERCIVSQPKTEYRFLNKMDIAKPLAAISKVVYCEGFLFLCGWIIPSDRVSDIKMIIDDGMVMEVWREERKEIKHIYLYRESGNCGFYYIGEIGQKEEINIKLRFFDNSQVIHSIEKKIANICYLEQYKNKSYDKIEQDIVRNVHYLLRIREELQKRIRNELQKKIELRKRLLYYHILYYLEVFTAKDMDSYLSQIEEVDDIEMQIWFCEQEIPWMIFVYPEITVKRLFQWQRKQYHSIAESLFTECKQQTERKEKNIVLLMDSLGKTIFSSTVLEVGIANELSKRGYRVQIVVVDTSCPSGTEYPSCLMRVRSSFQYAKEHEEIKEGNWDVYYCKEENFVQKELEVYEVIEQFMPGVIIDISHAGMIVSAGLYQHGYKIIHLPLFGYCSGAVFHRYIAKSKEICLEENKIYHSLEEKHMIDAPFLVQYTLKGNKEYSREEIGLREDDFVIVTVGNRLRQELKEEFLCVVKQLLDQDKAVKWIVVNKGLSNMFYSLLDSHIASKQVLDWGYEDDLVALYQLCDCYLNPNRLGGGGSVIMAMQMGIPIAMTKALSDVTSLIKRENCKEDYINIMDYIAELKNSRDLWEKESKKMQALINREEISMQCFVEKILNAYNELK